jgi:glycosyltransferase involved in cell wall biosynthesis
MPKLYSFIIPVYNRPDELGELLHSIAQLDQAPPFEVIVIDDGSTYRSNEIIERYKFLDIHYYFKENTGPGDSRNFGMRKAIGDYFIILDSDCILTADYLGSVDKALNEHCVDCFGGPDAAHPNFNLRQKAISFVMTSFWTTGGVRGSKRKLKRFEPRSFNMGLSKVAFERSNGFSQLHPGEDPELVHRLWDMSFETAFIEKALVYHKRRISWNGYARQIYKFGLARSILNFWRPQTASWVFWMPFFAIMFGITSLVLALLGNNAMVYFVVGYTVIMAFIAGLKLKSIQAFFMVPFAFVIQLISYARGFFVGWLYLQLLKRDERKQFPYMFYNQSNK